MKTNASHNSTALTYSGGQEEVRLSVSAAVGHTVYYQNDDHSNQGGSVSVAVVLLIGVSLILFATVSNCFVVGAIATKRSLRKRSNALYVSLAVADILVATCVTTLALANDVLDRWPFGAFMCHFWIALDVMCCTASILSIAAVAFDRYLNISDPFAYNRLITKRRMAAAICTIWILSAIISFIPIGLGWHERVTPRLSRLSQNGSSGTEVISGIADDVLIDSSHGLGPLVKCKFEINLTYAIVSSLISFYIPCLVVVIVYAKLYRIARRHYDSITRTALAHHLVSRTAFAIGAFANKYSLQESVNATISKTSTFKEKKAAVTLGFIIAAFLATWTPYFIVNILGAIDASLIQSQVFMVVTYMGYMNSCIDPIVYVVFQVDFRQALRSTMAKCRKSDSCKDELQRWRDRSTSPRKTLTSRGLASHPAPEVAV